MIEAKQKTNIVFLFNLRIKNPFHSHESFSIVQLYILTNFEPISLFSTT